MLNKKGFSGIGLILGLAIIATIGTFIYIQIFPEKQINQTELQGIILSKGVHEHYSGKGTHHKTYYIEVESSDKKSLTFSISQSEYNALEEGQTIKYYSYQIEGREKVYYQLGTPQSPEFIILIDK